MKMELIEDIGCTAQLAPARDTWRYFLQLESVEFKCCFAIEKIEKRRGNFLDAICHVNVQFF